MVDPVSLGAVTTAVTAAAGSVGTEAGRQAWESLTGLVRRAFGRGREEEGDSGTLVLPLDPQDREQVQELSALIFGQARQDARFAAEYREWEEQAARLQVSVDNSRVTNTVSRSRVDGPLIQGRDLNITWNGK